MTSAPYVFISHSSKNNALARRFYHDLTAAGLSSWLDVHAIRDGERWVSQIEAAVEDCAVMVILHTKAARSSEWVEREILLAMEHNKPMLIARCEEAPLPLPLITRQYTDFTNYDEGLKHMLEALKSVLSKPLARETVEEPESLADEEQFFVYLRQLPYGSLTALVARDLYTWANTWADDLTFKGQHAPSLYVQHQLGQRMVSLFAIRGYVQNPAVQIAFDHLTRYAPSLTLQLDEYHERIAAIQPPLDPLAPAPRRPNIQLRSLDTAEKLETFKTLIDEIREHLQGTA